MKKGFLKSAIAAALVLVMGLGAFGCATMGGLPPAGCEDSMLWRSGVMPYGPTIVKGAFAGVVMAKPDLRDDLLVAVRMAQDLLESEGTEAAALWLVNGLLAGVDNPAMIVVVQDGVRFLLDIANAPEHLLDPCDKQIIKNMIADIIVVLEAGQIPTP